MKPHTEKCLDQVPYSPYGTSVARTQKNTLRPRSFLLDEKRRERYFNRGAEGAAGCFLETTTIP